MTSAPSGSRQRGRGVFAAVTPATVFSAASGYVVLLLAAGSLGADRYEQFAVYWGLFFALAGVLGGIANETTRSVHARAHRRPDHGVSPFLASWGVGVATAVVATLTSPLWSGRLIPGHELAGTLLLAAALVSLAPQMALMGALAGLRRWRPYALEVTLDAGVRLALAVAVVTVSTPEVGFLVVTVAGAFTWPVLVTVSSRARGATRARGDVDTAQFWVRTTKAMLAGGALAVVMVGFPALLKLTDPDADPRTLSTLILAVTLTRAPLLVPLTAFQNAMVVHFAQRRQDLGAVGRPLLLVAAITLVGAVLADLVGPTVLSWMGEGFVVEGTVLLGLTLGAGALALAVVTGYAALARELHNAYLVGWWLAVVVVVATLLTPLGLETRVVMSLVVGPLAAACYHLVAMVRAARSGARGTT